VTEYTRPATWDDVLLKTKQGIRPKDQMDAAVLRQAIAELKK
jgi:hypothetical protein